MAEKGNGKAADATKALEAAWRKKQILLIAVAVVAILLSLGTMWYLFKEKAAAANARSPELPDKALYVELEPAFIVTYADTRNRQRYLQTFLTVLARDPQAVELVKMHLPLIRHRLNLLLGEQDFQALRTDAGKQALRTDSVRIINEFLATQATGVAIEQVLFTNFVMQ